MGGSRVRGARLPSGRGSAHPAGREGGRARDRLRGLRLDRGHGEAPWSGSSRRAPKGLPERSGSLKAGLRLAASEAHGSDLVRKHRAGCAFVHRSHRLSVRPLRVPRTAHRNDFDLLASLARCKTQPRGERPWGSSGHPTRCTQRAAFFSRPYTEGLAGGLRWIRASR